MTLEIDSSFYLPSYAKDYDFTKRDERLDFALKQAGVNERQAALSVGTSQPSLNQFKNGKSKTLRKMNELAEYLEVNAIWLETGDGNPYTGTKKDPASSLYLSIKMNKMFYESFYVKKFPTRKFNSLNIQISALDSEKICSQNLSYLIMPDDSMADEIRHNSTVIIDEKDQFIENGKLYAIMLMDQITIRRVYHINKTITLKISNNNSVYEDQLFEYDERDQLDFKILAKVKLVKNYYF